MIPTHLGIIMDGNRRFARQIAKRPWIGHKYGLKKARSVLRWTCEAGIKFMTAYTLSLENMRTRPKRELAIILKYIGKEADTIMNDKKHPVHKFKVRVRFIGRIGMLPDDIQTKLKAVEEATRHYRNHTLNIAVAYGGQQEIVDAIKNMTKKVMKGLMSPADLNEDIVRSHLYTDGQPEPDLIVRTGGEKRLSNFLPYQSAYSELTFIDKKWPELTKKDFDKILDNFAQRQRRFGR